jgi:hypothetical protein
MVDREKKVTIIRSDIPLARIPLDNTFLSRSRAVVAVCS